MGKRGVEFLIVIGLILFSTLACLSSGGVSTPSTITPPGPSGSTPTAVSPTEPSLATPTVNSSPEPGLTQAALNQTAGEIEGLKSYQVRLFLVADGSKEGEPIHWEYTITQTVSTEANLVIISIRTAGLSAGNNLTDTVFIDNGQRLLAIWSHGSYCIEESKDLSAGLIDTLFDLLPDLGGAAKDKSGEIEGLTADHYSLSGSQSGVSGELWAAQDSGFWIRASLKQEGEIPSLGLNLTGSASWDYQLTRFDQPIESLAPESCRNLLGSFPLPEDANDLAANENSITFTSATSITELATFYIQKMNTLGWESPEPAMASDDSAQMVFLRQLERISILMLRRGEVTVVTILISAGSTPTPPNP